MEMRTKIQKWGNSLGLRISGPIRNIPKFKANMFVNVKITEKGIEVLPAKRSKKALPFCEAQLLKGLTQWTSHADVLAFLSDKELGEK